MSHRERAIPDRGRVGERTTMGTNGPKIRHGGGPPCAFCDACGVRQWAIRVHLETMVSRVGLRSARHTYPRQQCPTWRELLHLATRQYQDADELCRQPLRGSGSSMENTTEEVDALKTFHACTARLAFAQC